MQPLPGKRRARVQLARGRDVRVCQHVPGLDAMPLDDIPGQGDQRFNLAVGVGHPADPLGGLQLAADPGLVGALIDNLDADGGIVEADAVAPTAGAGVPGTARLGHQLKHHG